MKEAKRDLLTEKQTENLKINIKSEECYMMEGRKIKLK